MTVAALSVRERDGDGEEWRSVRASRMAERGERREVAD